MLMHDFGHWLELAQKEDEKEFEEEFVNFIQCRFVGLPLGEMFISLAREIYELQVCVEGLIEDQEAGLQ